ncbi:MAG: hypothetical protein M3R69_05630, partial [Acidobacteriota bacterium]|nr:hypothetical protein [Acidobacteriota bacterium]
MHRKSRAQGSALVLFAGIALFNLSGCARTPTVNQTQPAASPSSSPSPKLITTNELAKLRWIEGTWRGTGVDQPPFYERYKFENDSTLIVEGLADETLSTVKDTSRFELKDGHFGHTEGESGSVATALDDNSITFAPVGKGNYFRFQRESDNSWKAILNWTAKDGTAKEVIY